MREMDEMVGRLHRERERLGQLCIQAERYDAYMRELGFRRVGIFGAQEALQETLCRWEPLRDLAMAEMLREFLMLLEECLDVFRRLQTIETQMQRKSEHTAEMEALLHAQVRERYSMENWLSGLRQRLADGNAELDDLRMKIAMEEDRHIELERSINDQRAQLERTRYCAEHLETDMRDLRQRLADGNAELDDLRMKVAMEEDRHRELERSVNDQRAQLERARYYAEHLEKDVCDLRQKNEEELKSIQHKIQREERLIQDLACVIQSRKEELEARQQERHRLEQEWKDLEPQPEHGLECISYAMAPEEDLQKEALRKSRMHMFKSRGAGVARADASGSGDAGEAAKCRTVPAPKTSKVNFSAVAPKKLVREEYSIIHVLMYEEDHRHIVDEVIAAEDAPVKETKSGIRPVEEGANIRVVLSSKDIELEDTVEEGVWYGQYLQFQFPVMLPADYSKANVLFTAVVYINGVISTRMNFVAACSAPRRQQMDVVRRDVMSAFISYASADRPRVAAVVQGIQKVRSDMDIFFDITSLHSGEYWEDKLMPEIDKRDILYLFWSKAASVSEWVDREWRHALEHKGLDCIEPIPLDKPKDCPPPEELKKKHFNDILLYIANGE